MSENSQIPKEPCCTQTTGDQSVIDNVKNYYGKTISANKDLKNCSACQLDAIVMPLHVKEALGVVHEEVVSRFYGCGPVVPDALSGCKVLDMGCGAGMDCYLLSRLVGENGFVTGVDMTDEQISCAEKYADYHRDKYGYKQSNVKFIKGYVEKLKEAGIEEEVCDIIISNGVVNLCADKEAVLRQAFNSLKTGGELYFSDVYCSRVLSDEFRKNKFLWGECIAGALYWRELINVAEKVGFSTPRLVTSRLLQNEQLRMELLKDPANANIARELAETKFISATYRLFKLPEVKETTPMEVTYKGTILHAEKEFVLDVNTPFTAGKVNAVDADVAAILKYSRFSTHFTFGPEASAAHSETATVDPFDLAEVGAAGGCGGGISSSKPCCS